MKIEWNGKRAIVTYDDGTFFNGQYDINKGRSGIGTLYDDQRHIISRGIWNNDSLTRELSDEEYNKLRIDW